MRTREPLIDWLSARRHHQWEWFLHSTSVQQQHHSSWNDDETVYTERERAIGFHLIYDPPVYLSSRWWWCWYIYFLLAEGLFVWGKRRAPVFVYELYGEWKGNEDISTTILTYWHFTIHRSRARALFFTKMKIPPRFLYSLWRLSVKGN